MLRDKAFDIAKDPKFDEYDRELASVVYKFSDERKCLVVVLKIFQIKN